MITPYGLGSGDVEGIETRDGEAFDPEGPAGDGFHHRHMQPGILSHRKRVGTLIGLWMLEEFLNQVVAGDDGETPGSRGGIPVAARRLEIVG